MSDASKPNVPGARPGQSGPPARFPTATSIAPADASTSVVLSLARQPQIEIGRVSVAAYADIVYAKRERPDGTTRQLLLDLLVPGNGDLKALIIYLPGGGFIRAAKEAGFHRRTFVAEAGYAVASVEYRTVPDGATYREAVADVKSAIRFLRANAQEYGLNVEKVAVWGESAGGYLAALAAVTNGEAAFETPDNAAYSSEVDAVIDQFGPSNLLRLAEDFDPEFKAQHLAPGNPAAAFVFGPGTTNSLADDVDAVAAADPSTHLDSATPPFLIFHGSADRIVSSSQTQLLHTALLAKGVTSTRYVVEGADHGDLAVMLGDPEAALPWSTQELLGYVVEFLDRELGPSSAAVTPDSSR